MIEHHPNLFLSLGLGLILLGIIPLIWGMSWIVRMAFQDEGPIWKILMIVAFMLFIAGFFVEKGTSGLFLGGAGLLMPLTTGLVFSTRIWQWAHRPMMLWLGGSFFFFLGLGVLYICQLAIEST